MLSFSIDKNRLEAGCDEAGRGCLAGPVVAAAVILPKTFSHPLLNDSKKLTEANRDKLRPIIEKTALSWAVCSVPPGEIDEINILNASFAAMHRAVDRLQIQPDHLAIDGNRFPAYNGIEHTCVIKGDGKYMHIAAASVLAKTHRDEIMYRLHEDYPDYSWNTNKGYPTGKHREAIRKIGTSPHHRQSFRQLPDQLEIEF